MAKRSVTPDQPEQPDLFDALAGQQPKAARPAPRVARPQKEALPTDKTYTLKEAAKLLQISEGVLRTTIKYGKIEAVRRGRSMVVRRSALMPFIDPLYDPRKAALPTPRPLARCRARGVM